MSPISSYIGLLQILILFLPLANLSTPFSLEVQKSEWVNNELEVNLVTLWRIFCNKTKESLRMRPINGGVIGHDKGCWWQNPYVDDFFRYVGVFSYRSPTSMLPWHRECICDIIFFGRRGPMFLTIHLLEAKYEQYDDTWTKNRVESKILKSTYSTVKINLRNPLRGTMMGNDDTIGIFVVRFWL